MMISAIWSSLLQQNNSIKPLSTLSLREMMSDLNLLSFRIMHRMFWNIDNTSVVTHDRIIFIHNNKIF